MTQRQDQRPYPGQVNQFGTPVDQFGTPVMGSATSVVPAVAPVPARRTEPVAVWALVLSIVLWPVGIVLSIVAMVRTGRPGAAGRGLAIAALVISVVQLVLAPVLAAIAIPVFLNQRNKAVEADLARDLGTAATVLHGERALQGVFPAELPQPVVTSGRTEQVLLVTSSADTFCLAATGGERVLYMDEQSLTSTRGCP